MQFGFIFVIRGKKWDDVEIANLLKNSDAFQILGARRLYFKVIHGDGDSENLKVGAHPIGSALPSDGTSRTIASIVEDGTITRVGSRDTYDKCLEIMKGVHLCRSCPYLGKACYRHAIEGVELGAVDPDASTTPYTYMGEGDLETVAGLRIAPYSSIARDTVAKTEFTPSEHDIDTLVENIVERVHRRSENAVKAAVTRKLKKAECSKCVYQDLCSTGYLRGCDGHFQDESLIWANIIAKELPALMTGNLPLTEIVTAMKYIGRETGKRPRLGFGGVERLHHNRQWSFVTYWAHQPNRARYTYNWEEVAKQFGIEESQSQMEANVVDFMQMSQEDLALQLYLMKRPSINTKNIGRGGWGGRIDGVIGRNWWKEDNELWVAGPRHTYQIQVKTLRDAAAIWGPPIEYRVLTPGSRGKPLAPKPGKRLVPSVLPADLAALVSVLNSPGPAQDRLALSQSSETTHPEPDSDTSQPDESVPESEETTPESLLTEPQLQSQPDPSSQEAGPA